MNRVRMGLTGLAFVFLIVVVTAVGRWPFGAGGPMPPEETLATLGVAPGAETGEPEVPQSPPAPQTPPPGTKQPLAIDKADNLTEI